MKVSNLGECIFLVPTFLVLVYYLLIFLPYSYASTGSEQVIHDNMHDWVNMKTRQIAPNEFSVPDITTVDYFADGKNLNATLWLFRPFKDPSLMNPSYKEVDYGMFIDSDFDSKTGFGGIDYKIEIGWDNETKHWTKSVEKWNDLGKIKNIETISNYTNFYAKGGSYVTFTQNWKKFLTRLSIR